LTSIYFPILADVLDLPPILFPEPRMELQDFALDRLRPHPQNSNVMPEALLKKLADHLETTDRYPPIIVRVHPPEFSESLEDLGPEASRQKGGTAAGDEPSYQIIDGHHRVEALRRIGRATARCVVWDVDDAEALLLLATLNRLQGQDDPRKRAALVGRLQEHLDIKALAARLPEDGDRLRKLMRMNEGMPTPRAPQAMGEMPVAVHFFVLPAERRAIERRLREAGADRNISDGDGHPGSGGSRERALLSLLGIEDASAGA